MRTPRPLLAVLTAVAVTSTLLVGPGHVRPASADDCKNRFIGACWDFLYEAITKVEKTATNAEKIPGMVTEVNKIPGMVTNVSGLVTKVANLPTEVTNLVVGPTAALVWGTAEAGMTAVVTPLLPTLLATAGTLPIEPLKGLATELAKARTDARNGAQGVCKVHADLVGHMGGVAYDSSKPETIADYRIVRDMIDHSLGQIIPDEAVKVNAGVTVAGALANACVTYLESEITRVDEAEEAVAYANITTQGVTTRTQLTAVEANLAALVNAVATELKELVATVQQELTAHIDGLDEAMRTLVNFVHQDILSKLGQAKTEITTHVTTEVNNLQGAISDDMAAEHHFDLVMSIHNALSQMHDGRNALFQLPPEQGGFLDLVRAVVTDTIAATRATGQTIKPLADRELANGNAHYAAGQYRDAYDAYKKAYDAATH